MQALQEAVGAEAQEVMAQVRGDRGRASTPWRGRPRRPARPSTAAIAGTAAAEAAPYGRGRGQGRSPRRRRRTPPAACARTPPGNSSTSCAARPTWPGPPRRPTGPARRCRRPWPPCTRRSCAATRDLTPTETWLKQSATRLTQALDELQAQLAAAGQDYRPEWDSADGVIVVRVADEQGPLPVAALRPADRRRTAATRQLLLSESEQRILEDALLTRLAQQIHDRTVDARDLIGRMNTDMRGRTHVLGHDRRA